MKLTELVIENNAINFLETLENHLMMNHIQMFGGMLSERESSFDIDIDEKCARKLSDKAILVVVRKLAKEGIKDKKSINDELAKKQAAAVHIATSSTTDSDLIKVVNKLLTSNNWEDLVSKDGCRTAVKNKYEELNSLPAESEGKIVQDDSCELPDYDKLLSSVKQTVVQYIKFADSAKMRHSIDLPENLSMVLINTNTLLELHDIVNVVNIEMLVNSTNNLINNILVEGCSKLILSNYIQTLKSLRKLFDENYDQLKRFLSKSKTTCTGSSNDELNKCADKFITVLEHTINKFSTNFKELPL